MQINQAGLDIIKEFEGLKLKAYKCPAGILTIGYGSTGPHVKPGMVITETEAEELLRKDLARFEEGVFEQVYRSFTTKDQYAAMVSLAFNIGLGAFSRSSVLRMHRAGEYFYAASAFLLWNKAGGKVLKGLVRRRQKEKELYER